jgi:hypothetical protein
MLVYTPQNEDESIQEVLTQDGPPRALVPRFLAGLGFRSFALEFGATWQVLPSQADQVVLSSGYTVKEAASLVSVRCSGAVQLSGAAGLNAKFTLLVDGVAAAGTKLTGSVSLFGNFVIEANLDSLTAAAHVFAIAVTTDAGTTVDGHTDDQTSAFLQTDITEYQDT